jgi:hypothetical protein
MATTRGTRQPVKRRVPIGRHWLADSLRFAQALERLRPRALRLGKSAAALAKRLREFLNEAACVPLAYDFSTVDAATTSLESFSKGVRWSRRGRPRSWEAQYLATLKDAGYSHKEIAEFADRWSKPRAMDVAGRVRTATWRARLRERRHKKPTRKSK